MRKLPLFMLFFLVGFSLFGQTLNEAKIFVPPIDGSGRPSDNVYFYRQLAYEVVLQFHSVVRSRRGSDYTLRGSIEPASGLFLDIPAAEVLEEMRQENYSPVPDMLIPPVRNNFGRREFFSMEAGNDIYFYDTKGDGNFEPRVVPPVQQATQSQTAMYIPEDGEEFVFKLEMIDSATGNVLGRQSIIYVTPDASVSELLSIIIYNMLSGIPDTYHSTDWRDKLFFFDITALWMPRIYYAEYQSINWLNFGLRLGGELHFAKFMSLGIAAQVTQDWVVLASAGIEEYRDLVLEIPASLKLVFKPADYYMVEPYGGVSWNYSIRGITEPSVMSWFAGLQFGIRSGSGMIVFDPRFSMDFYNSKLPERNVEYQRYCIQFGIGYKVGAAQKRFRIQEY